MELLDDGSDRLAKWSADELCNGTEGRPGCGSRWRIWFNDLFGCYVRSQSVGPPVAGKKAVVFQCPECASITPVDVPLYVKFWVFRNRFRPDSEWSV